MNLTRARPVGAGDIEVLPFVALVGGRAQDAARDVDMLGFGVNAGLAARFGLTDWMDLGVLGSAEQSGYLRLDTKLTMVDEPAAAFAVLPGISSHVFAAASGEPALELRAPLLLDVELGGGIALVLGPSYTAMLYIDGDRTTWEHWLGASVGLDIPFSPHVRVLPELSVPIVLDGRWQVYAVSIALATVMEF